MIPTADIGSLLNSFQSFKNGWPNSIFVSNSSQRLLPHTLPYRRTINRCFKRAVGTKENHAVPLAYALK